MKILPIRGTHSAFNSLISWCQLLSNEMLPSKGEKKKERKRKKKIKKENKPFAVLLSGKNVWDGIVVLHRSPPWAALARSTVQPLLQWTRLVQVRDRQFWSPSMQPTIMFWLLYLFNLAFQRMDIQSAKALISL